MAGRLATMKIGPDGATGKFEHTRRWQVMKGNFDSKKADGKLKHT